MLAQNFMKPKALGITEIEVAAMIRVLGMLERGEITQRMLRMDSPRPEVCDTALCIVGWARHIDRRAFREPIGEEKRHKRGLVNLFYPNNSRAWDAAPAQAAIALRNYLTTGEPRWSEALAG